MNSRRGLTLLEVLLAATLLAALAAATLPLLAQALQTLGEDESIDTHDDELQRIADAACAEFTGRDGGVDVFVIGASEQQRLLGVATLQLIRNRSLIRVRRLDPTTAGNHCWIDFERENRHAYRWVGISHGSSATEREEPKS